jgi:hypothetical protein
MSEERISREEIEDLAPKLAEAIKEVMMAAATDEEMPEELQAAPNGDDEEKSA